MPSGTASFGIRNRNWSMFTSPTPGYRLAGIAGMHGRIKMPALTITCSATPQWRRRAANETDIPLVYEPGQQLHDPAHRVAVLRVVRSRVLHVGGQSWLTSWRRYRRAFARLWTQLR